MSDPLTDAARLRKLAAWQAFSDDTELLHRAADAMQREAEAQAAKNAPPRATYMFGGYP